MQMSLASQTRKLRYVVYIIAYNFVMHICAQFRDVVNSFAEKNIAPRAAEIDRTNKFPIVCCMLPYRYSIISLNLLCRISGPPWASLVSMESPHLRNMVDWNSDTFSTFSQWKHYPRTQDPLRFPMVLTPTSA